MAFESLSDKLSAAFKRLRSKGKLNESDIKEAMREVKLALLEADVNYKVVKDFVKTVSERAVGQEVLESLTPAQQVIKIVNEELTALMGGENARIEFASKPPTVILMCGLQGSGKTTHAAKLAKYFKDKEGCRPLLIACDVYRPAAIEQLQIVGQRAGAKVFEKGQGDPVEIAKEGLKYARDHGYDLVIVDTAGRLHIDETLMEELKRIEAAVSPNEILLVVDSMTGQDAVTVADTFNKALPVTGIILTKLDSDTRGGAAISVKQVTGKPIKFSGTGEKLDDIEPFHPGRMASRILGMGDVLTLIEKAQETVDEKEAEKLAKKMAQNAFDMNDLLEQMQQIKKMGSVRSIVSMLPGAAKISDENIEQGDKQLKVIEAMIQSMTKRERENPSIINPSRKRRIAAGSGTRVEDVNRLLRQFEQMKQMMKKMGAFGKKGKRRMKLPPLKM
ncbi:MAG TPA: signal recognition particle protein [Candidatus Faecivivens stercoravium]|uniref:Signal recognition particle protein n=1 Tax=Candidatus Faecivivens stercoravium TaxID=2840803 RepID=A0A9D1DZ87_9FIRM|nr:signal recognition particle protein [Candidatus Faecivivens stercoravium]